MAIYKPYSRSPQRSALVGRRVSMPVDYYSREYPEQRPVSMGLNAAGQYEMAEPISRSSEVAEGLFAPDAVDRGLSPGTGAPGEEGETSLAIGKASIYGDPTARSSAVQSLGKGLLAFATPTGWYYVGKGLKGLADDYALRESQRAAVQASLAAQSGPQAARGRAGRGGLYGLGEVAQASPASLGVAGKGGAYNLGAVTLGEPSTDLADIGIEGSSGGGGGPAAAGGYAGRGGAADLGSVGIDGGGDYGSWGGWDGWGGDSGDSGPW